MNLLSAIHFARKSLYYLIHIAGKHGPVGEDRITPALGMTIVDGMSFVAACYWFETTFLSSTVVRYLLNSGLGAILILIFPFALHIPVC